MGALNIDRICLHISFLSLSIRGDISNFNTYALMLTYVSASDNILFHASHDSNVVSSPKTQNVLSQLQNVVMQLATYVRN